MGVFDGCRNFGEQNLGMVQNHQNLKSIFQINENIDQNIRDQTWMKINENWAINILNHQFSAPLILQ